MAVYVETENCPLVHCFLHQAEILCYEAHFRFGSFEGERWGILLPKCRAMLYGLGYVPKKSSPIYLGFLLATA